MAYRKPSLLHPDEGNPAQTVNGFDFTRDDFENLIDNFTDQDSIMRILRVSHDDLDVFCNAIYNMNFKETYIVLYEKAQLYFRTAMISLSKAGNPSAIKVATEYYLKLGNNSNPDDKITFVGFMPLEKSDVELLAEKQKNNAGDNPGAPVKTFNNDNQGAK